MADVVPGSAPLLATCLRGEPLNACNPACLSSIDWPSLLKEAEAHGILLLVHEALTTGGIEVPDFFREAAIAQWVSMQMLTTGLQSALTLLDGIEVMPLKGPLLSESLYGDIALRYSNDLDLLVHPNNFAQAEAILLANEFTAAEKDDYHCKFTRDNLIIELHHDLASPRGLPFDVNGVWVRSAPASFRDRPIRVMSQFDRALYLCLHGLKHSFTRLIWIADIERALIEINKAPSGIDSLIQFARELDLQAALFVACEAVRSTLGLPSEIEAHLKRYPMQTNAARRAAQLLLEENVPAGDDPEIWGFYLEFETGFRSRWRRRLGFFTPTVEDRKWVAGKGLPRAFAPLLRPFRLLKKYGMGRAWSLLFPRRS